MSGDGGGGSCSSSSSDDEMKKERDPVPHRHGDEEEDEESYGRRVYGPADGHNNDGGSLEPRTSSSRRSGPSSTGQRQSASASSLDRRRPSSFRRLSRQLSERSSGIIRRSSSVLKDSMPETPAGWTLLVTTMLSATLGYELNLQRQLTAPPVVFYQKSAPSSNSSFSTNSFMDRVYLKMTKTPTSILSRNIHPSLFVGTRGLVSSTAAYLTGGPVSSSKSKFVRLREVMTMTQDGAQLALDWEVPRDILTDEEEMQTDSSGSTSSSDGDTQDDKQSTIERIRRIILNGPMSRPVVIILHGINNDASFGYMRNLQRSYVERGWVATCMNFRGCGGIKMTTPRGYNGAYTGDLRSVVQQISSRLMTTTKTYVTRSPRIFLVGNSLGANILTKYLGEEGAAGTLPSCVAGAASLGNPLVIHSGLVRFPFNVLMGLGVKKIYVENWKEMTSMKDFYSKHCFRKMMAAPTIAAFDDAMAPCFVRNDSSYPFGFKVGYNDGESYWFDASSYRYLSHINIPFLNLTARDDFLVSKPSRNKLGFCISNPNVMVVETRCGGHLGWQESPPDNSTYGSYADACTTAFFDAIIQADNESTPQEKKEREDARTADCIQFVDTVLKSQCSTINEVDGLRDSQLSSIKSDAEGFLKSNLSTRSRL